MLGEEVERDSVNKFFKIFDWRRGSKLEGSWRGIWG